jgi:hypothetical protein
MTHDRIKLLEVHYNRSTTVTEEHNTCVTPRQSYRCNGFKFNLINFLVRYKLTSTSLSVQSSIGYVRFEVFAAVTMKNAVFWDLAPCRSCELNRRFGGTYRLHLQCRKIPGSSLQGFFYHEDGGDRFHRNVGSIHKLYMAPHPRRRHSSGIEYIVIIPHSLLIELHRSVWCNLWLLRT